ncbi:helix-turn-helix transcriptional regulator [uncultured Cedecea sp.]|uniref:helix-turn-helix transcriptional regulator n=1 Tax=uncultured Cedecea sp. TaxID=988762 RepID=UPI0026301D5A|nr:AraC family transcriptional regulator [uncultured Cedecea sp.]
MSRPSALYVPHILNAKEIEPEERIDQIAANLSCYGIEVADNRRPEDIIAVHKTISGVMGHYCSALGSKNDIIFDPHKAKEPMIYISLIMQGDQIINGRKNNNNTQVDQGKLILHLRDDYCQYQSTDVKELYVIPHADQVKTVLTGKLNQHAISLDNHYLAAFLKSHMLHLDQQSASLNTKETALIVDSLHHMALLMMSDVAKEKGMTSEDKQKHIFNAAKSYIKQNFSQHEISPDSISKVLRCSRASLDRAFNEQGTSVMLVIKGTRLDAARGLLENNRTLRIEQISWLCGFVNHSLFSKLFKEKYKVSPKSWRDNFNGCL